MRAFLAMGGVYFCGLFSMTAIRCFHCENGLSRDGSLAGSIRSAKLKALDNFGKQRQPIAEAYVISLHESKFNVFEQRHFDMVNDNDDDTKETNNFSLEWFQGYDGFDQAVLDEFSTITGLKKQSVSEFKNMTTNEIKGKYNSPHSVGCYLSHWRLLEKVQKQWKKKKSFEDIKTKEPAGGKPDMLFVFEDDAHCVTNLVDRTWQVVQKLPKDWDILYIGGKPFSRHSGNKTLSDLVQLDTEEIPRPSDAELAQRTCNAEFGSSVTGPFPPGTSEFDSFENSIGANLAEDPPYWQTKYILNTNSYVINPKRIQRVLRVLSEPMHQYKPIDVTLAEDMDRAFWSPQQAIGTMEGPAAPLKAFMTPNMYCDQEVKRVITNRNEPVPWEGYFYLPWRSFKGFPDPTGFLWGKMASRQTCAEQAKTTATE